MKKETDKVENESNSILKIDEELKLFGALTNNISSGIILIKNDVIAYVNNAMLNLSGYINTEVLNQEYEMLFYDDDIKLLSQFFSELQIRGNFNLEINLKTKDGKKRICILNAVLFDPLDPLIGIVCTFSDITERKQTEERLRQSEEFYSTLLDSVWESLVGIDANYKIVLFNTAAKILFKRSTIECIGRSHEILFEGIHKEIIKRYIQGFFENVFQKDSNPGVLEMECLNSAKEVFPVEISISTANFRGSNLVLLSIRDITRRKRYESALKRKQKEQEALLNNIPDLVFFTDANFAYIAANNSFCDFVETDEKSVIGKKDIDLFSDESKISRISLYKEVIDTQKSISSEGILTSKNSKTIYAITTVTPISDENEKFVGLVGISRDITERREKEIALQKFTRELEETKKDLERKTYELIRTNQDLLLSRTELEKYSSQLSEQNKTLKESEIRLQNLNMQKNKFVSIISHDLRNPFASLLGYAEMLEMFWDSTPDPKKIEYIKAIHGSAQHQLNQLNNLLEWARYADGRIPFKSRLINLSEILYKSQQSLVGIKQKKNITFVNNINENINILGDKNLLYRLFENLIGNSLKFTPENGNLWITTNFIEGEKNVFVSIKDDGIGIPSEILPSLFQLQGKVSRRGTNGEPGTGLGLILCKEIIELHQGSITVESKEGEGATFTLNLPLASKEIIAFVDSDDEFEILKNSFLTLNKNYDFKKASTLSQIQSLTEKKFPCLLLVDLKNAINQDLLINESGLDNLLKITPIIIIEDQEDALEKKFPQNNVVHVFFNPIDNESISQLLGSILI